MAGNRVTTTGVININGQQVENTFNSLRRTVAQYERQLRNLTPGTEEYIRVSQNLRQVRRHYEEVRNEIRGTNREINESNTLMGRIKEIFTGNVAADFFSNATSKVVEWGKELAERVQQLVEIKSNLLSLDSALKGVSLDRAAVSVQSIADTYGKGVEEIMLAVKALNAQTGDTNKSLDLIKKGFDAGADASGEMLTQLKEYPTMMNDAKVSAEQMIAIIAQSEKMGVYDDKGIDAIKEGMLRVREGTKTTKDAMKALGIDVDATYKKISSGAMSYFDVLKIVSKKIKDTGADSRITGTAIADIFGGPGEDAGYKYLSQIQDINTNLDELTQSTNQIAIAKKYELEANERLNSVWVQLTGTASTLSKAYSSLKLGLASVLETVFNIKQAKLSDEYLQEEYRLRYLKSQLDQTNISQGRRVEIYNELKSKWPQYFSGLDLEKMKHDEITAAVNRTIDAMGRKYKAQVFQEKFDKTNLKATESFIQVVEYEEKGKTVIGQFLKDYPDFKFKAKATVNQLREIEAFLLKDIRSKQGNGTIFDANSWSIDTDFLRTVQARTKSLSDANKVFNIDEKKRIEEQAQLMKLESQLLPEPFKIPTNTPTPSTDIDLDAQAAAEAELKKRLKAAETERKKLEKQKEADINDSEKLVAESNNRLLELEAQFYADRANLEEASLDNEIDAENAKRSVELNKQREYQDQVIKNIQDLQKKISETKSPEAKANYEKALQDELVSLQTHDQIVLNSEVAHQKKLLAIQYKWQDKRLEEFIKAKGYEVAEKARKDEEEIQSLTSLSEIKSRLKKNEYLKLTKEEFKEIDTLEKGKAVLREGANRKALEQQLLFLEEQRKNLVDAISGMIDGPEKKKILEDLKVLEEELTKIRGQILGGKEADQGKAHDSKKKARESVDILGFSAADWNSTFDNIQNLEDGLRAASVVFQALGNAATIYADLQRALGDRELRNFKKVQERKKSELDKNLALGLISQENYKKQTELMDAQLANKQAEIEYKQAKAEKMSKLFSAIGGVAMGVANSLAVGGPAGIARAAIVGALGAVQIGTIAAQPLPELQTYAKGGYFEGFTGDSNLPADETGERPFANVRLHRREWVAPRWMTEHPQISKDINRLEFMRANKITKMAEGGYPDSGSMESSSGIKNSNDYNLHTLFTTLLNLFQKIDDEGGIEAYIAENPKNEKKLRTMMKRRETLENKNKR